jgi:amidophosphoribosyltransferase
MSLLCFSGADSLAYLSVEGLVQAVTYRIEEKNSSKVGHCTACLTGNYPEKLEW